MRGLSIPPPHQLALQLLGDEPPTDVVWETLPQEARERTLRILARAIAGVLQANEEAR